MIDGLPRPWFTTKIKKARRLNLAFFRADGNRSGKLHYLIGSRNEDSKKMENFFSIFPKINVTRQSKRQNKYSKEFYFSASFLTPKAVLAFSQYFSRSSNPLYPPFIRFVIPLKSPLSARSFKSFLSQ